jgi:hypothetical protein
VDKKLWPFGDDLRKRFEQTRVQPHSHQQFVAAVVASESTMQGGGPAVLVSCGRVTL